MKQELTAAFVCLRCRKVFKRASHRLVGKRYEALNCAAACPQCQTALLKVGDTFRAPPKTDLVAWAKVELDLRNGRTFAQDEGFGQPPRPPKRQHTPKGLRSLFQLPARKRRGKVQPLGAGDAGFGPDVNPGSAGRPA
jgi:hypothetical protein